MESRKDFNRARGRRTFEKKKHTAPRKDIEDAVALLKSDPENPEMNANVYKAIRLADLRMVSALLANGLEIKPLDDSMRTAVHLAFGRNQPQLVNQFLRHCDKKVNHSDVDGLSHFHIACISGFERLVSEFIENGIDPNLRVGSNGPTPLQLAVKHAMPDVVRQLLRHGADVSITDELGRTVLHLACGIYESIGEIILSTREPKEIDVVKQKTSRIVQQLLQSGISVDARDRYGESPLFHVFRDDMLDYVARKFLKDSLDYRIYHNEFRRTKLALIASLRMSQQQKLKLLLSHKANVWIRNQISGDTILHRTIEDLETLRDPRQFGEPIFEDAAHARMVQDLLKRGIEVNVVNGRGETALSIATSLLSLNVVSVLRDHGAKTRDIRFDRGFRYPGLLPSLEAVHNFLEIAAMRKSNLSNKESLTVLTFLVKHNAECKYADPNDEDAAQKLRNLLEFGTDENVINTLQRIVEDDGYSRGIVNDEINRYLIKIRMNGMHLSRRVEDCLVRVKALADTPDVPYREIDEFKTEATRMRETKLTSGRTLASILTAPPAEIFSFVKRREYREILSTKYMEFARIFRHNWGIVRGYLAKFLVRNFVVKALNEQIRFVTRKPLPDHCCERIAVYLSNEDLLSLCTASCNVEETIYRETEARNLTDRFLAQLRVT